MKKWGYPFVYQKKKKKQKKKQENPFIFQKQVKRYPFCFSVEIAFCFSKTKWGYGFVFQRKSGATDVAGIRLLYYLLLHHCSLIHANANTSKQEPVFHQSVFKYNVMHVML